MEHKIEFGAVADAYGKLPAQLELMLEGIPELARKIDLELDPEKSGWHRHTGGKRGGARFVRYVAVAPDNVDAEVWKARAAVLEGYIRQKLSGRNPRKR